MRLIRSGTFLDPRPPAAADHLERVFQGSHPHAGLASYCWHTAKPTKHVCPGAPPACTDHWFGPLGNEESGAFES